MEASARVQMEFGKSRGVAAAGILRLESIKASGGEDEFFQQWAGHYTKALRGQQDLTLASLNLGIVPGFLQLFAVSLVLVAGGFRVMDGSITIGMLVAFQSLMIKFQQPFGTLVALSATFQELHADLGRLDDVLSQERDARSREPHEQPSRTEAATRLDGRLEMRGVTFGYSRVEKPLISGFEISIEPGRRIAVVGGSGSGKSTLARLISGLYQPWEGDVFFDGLRMSELSRDVLSRSIALVDQDVLIFEGTIRENLALWDDSIPLGDMARACEDAAILDIIQSFPDGFETRLIENGANLSGGQRQRLEIARALVKNPSILILDEATSALDPMTEQIIMANIARRNCTCVMIAHRLSAIRDADRIIVMNRGEVTQRGTHETLSTVEGDYRDLIRVYDEG